MEGRAPGHAKYAATLRAMPFEDLQGHAKDVAALVSHPGWEFVQQLLGEYERRLVDRMVSSPEIPSHQQFVNQAAEISGLRACRDAAQTVLAVAAEEDQAEHQRAEAAVAQEEGALSGGGI